MLGILHSVYSTVGTVMLADQVEHYVPSCGGDMPCNLQHHNMLFSLAVSCDSTQLLLVAEAIVEKLVPVQMKP